MKAESDQVRALRTRYKESLPEKAALVREWHHQETGNGISEAGIDDLSSWLHKLAGSAGMYEYQDISDFARSLMHALPDLNSQELISRLMTLESLLEGAAK